MGSPSTQHLPIPAIFLFLSSTLTYTVVACRYMAHLDGSSDKHRSASYSYCPSDPWSTMGFIDTFIMGFLLLAFAMNRKTGLCVPPPMFSSAAYPSKAVGRVHPPISMFLGSAIPPLFVSCPDVWALQTASHSIHLNTPRIDRVADVVRTEHGKVSHVDASRGILVVDAGHGPRRCGCPASGEGCGARTCVSPRPTPSISAQTSLSMLTSSR